MSSQPHTKDHEADRRSRIASIEAILTAGAHDGQPLTPQQRDRLGHRLAALRGEAAPRPSASPWSHLGPRAGRGGIHDGAGFYGDLYGRMRTWTAQQQARRQQAAWTAAATTTQEAPKRRSAEAERIRDRVKARIDGLDLVALIALDLQLSHDERDQ